MSYFCRRYSLQNLRLHLLYINCFEGMIESDISENNISSAIFTPPPPSHLKEHFQCSSNSKRNSAQTFKRCLKLPNNYASNKDVTSEILSYQKTIPNIPNNLHWFEVHQLEQMYIKRRSVFFTDTNWTLIQIYWMIDW